MRAIPREILILIQLCLSIAVFAGPSERVPESLPPEWLQASGSPESCPYGYLWYACPPSWRTGVPCPFASELIGDPACTGEGAYDWDFGDGSPHSSEADPVHTYSASGFYNPTVDVRWPDGQVAHRGGWQIHVIDAPFVTGSGIPDGPYAPVTVRFTSFHENPDPHCPGVEWSFGDGTTSTEANPVHIYGQAGSYDGSMKYRYWSAGAQKCFDSSVDYHYVGSFYVQARCKVTQCSAQVPATGLANREISFNSYTQSDCTGGDILVTWDFGDGTPPANTTGWTNHTYTQAGTFHWTYQFFNRSWNVACQQEGDIVISFCNLQCTAQGPSQAEPGETVWFNGSIVMNDCWGPWTYDWDFGDGTPHASTEQASHDYDEPGVYTWKLTVRQAGATCVKTGTVSVGCLQVGSLYLCADQIQESSGTYTLTGSPHINDVLFFDGAVAFQGDPASGEGVLTTAGSIRVDNGPVGETLYQGTNLAFDVDGKAGTLTPQIAPELYACKLAGLALRSNGPIKVGEESVTIKPIFYIGIFGLMTIASIEATIEYPEDEYKQVRSFEVVAGQGTPSMQVLQLKGSYDPETDILSGTVGLDFPFMEGAPEFEATLRMWHDCINGFDFTSSFFDIPFAPPYAQLAHTTIKVDNICKPTYFSIFMGGNVTYMQIPEEILLLKDVGLKYTYPFLFRIQGGTATFFGYEIGSIGGTVGYKPGHYGFTFQWSVNIADAYDSTMNVGLSLNRMLFQIRADGTLRIPDFQCGLLNLPCRLLRRAIRAAVALPYEIQGVHKEGVILRTQAGDFSGHLRGMVALGPLNATVQLEIRNTDWSLLVGSNFQDLFEVGARGVPPEGLRASEQAVSVPAGRPVVLFGAASGIAFPAITLRNPAGQTITPENAASFPGVTYLPGEGENLALFQVLNPAAGTWVLGQSNLPPDQATLAALSPAPAPQTAFTSVQRQGNSVSIAASVTPASADTKVGFLFTEDPQGAGGEWIAVDLPAATGTVTATWDLAGLDSGSYYLVALTDDGMNPVARTVYSQPIAIDSGLVAAPTGLHGTRSGSEITLGWNPSGTPGVGAYQILYTDAPDRPGYPLFEGSPLPDEAVIGGIDSGKSYKFCVLAIDSQGNRSLPSPPWISWAPGAVPGDCDGSGTLSIGEVQKAINMYLGLLAVGCGADCNGNGTLSIGEVQKVVNAYLGISPGC